MEVFYRNSTRQGEANHLKYLSLAIFAQGLEKESKKNDKRKKAEKREATWLFLLEKVS